MTNDESSMFWACIGGSISAKIYLAKIINPKLWRNLYSFDQQELNVQYPLSNHRSSEQFESWILLMGESNGGFYTEQLVLRERNFEEVSQLESQFEVWKRTLDLEVLYQRW